MIWLLRLSVVGILVGITMMILGENEMSHRIATNTLLASGGMLVGFLAGWRARQYYFAPHPALNETRNH